MRPLSVLVALTATSVAAPPAPAQEPPPVVAISDIRFDSEDHVARFPIELHDWHIFFRGSLGDSSLVWLTLDTGAASGVIDAEYARARGLEHSEAQPLFGPAGSTASARVGGLSLTLPGVRMQNLALSTTPLQFLSAATGRRIVAILGYEFLSAFIVEIDYAGREMRLHDPAHYAYRGKGGIVPFTLRDNDPFVRAQLEMPGGGTLEGEFVIDTGSGSTVLLASDFAAAHGLPGGLAHKLEARARGVGGEMKIVAGRLPGVRLGRFRVEDPVVLFPAGQITEPGSAGNIGGGLLRRFRVIFDYPGRRMILEPQPGPAEREEFDMSGIALTARGAHLDSIRVERVRSNSPGDEAGVKPGDLLERVNGRAAPAIGLDSLRTLFRKETTCDLVLRREGRALPVKLKTRRLL